MVEVPEVACRVFRLKARCNGRVGGCGGPLLRTSSDCGDGLASATDTAL